MTTRLSDRLEIHRLENFNVQTLHVESHALKGNPLGDSTHRAHPVLIPIVNSPPPQGFPVVFVLSGYTGNGPNYLNIKTFEPNMVQLIDKARTQGGAPAAVFVLIDAMTAWGGSQFINSEGTGRYEDFILETVDALKANLPVAKDPSQWCVTGG